MSVICTFHYYYIYILIFLIGENNVDFTGNARHIKARFKENTVYSIYVNNFTLLTINQFVTSLSVISQIYLYDYLLCTNPRSQLKSCF